MCSFIYARKGSVALLSKTFKKPANSQQNFVWKPYSAFHRDPAGRAGGKDRNSFTLEIKLCVSLS